MQVLQPDVLRLALLLFLQLLLVLALPVLGIWCCSAGSDCHCQGQMWLDVVVSRKQLPILKVVLLECIEQLCLTVLPCFSSAPGG